MKKLVLGFIITALFASGLIAEDRYTGTITYVQVRTDGDIAIKVLPNGATKAIYGKTNGANPEQAKAIYAMALTALSTGKEVEAWLEGGYWTSTFLRQ